MLRWRDGVPGGGATDHGSVAAGGGTGVRAVCLNRLPPNGPEPPEATQPAFAVGADQGGETRAALPLHSGGKGRMRFRDIYVRDLTHP